MKKIFENSWQELLEDELNKVYYQNLRKFLINEYRTQTIYPEMDNIYNALHYTDYDDVKVLLLGQDPYHGPNQAHGFAFSVKEGVRIPPSLLNMYKELETDLGYKIPNHGNLKKWADEGVLLLNTALTVRQGQANSHSGKGWEILTDHIIKLVNKREDPVVFILWGSNARSKKQFIDREKHMIIEAVHPSPLSAYRGFFGSKPYSRTNNFLKSVGKEPIDWKIENR